MAKGGKRPGAGRRSSVPQKLKIAEEIKVDGTTPLQFFLDIFRDTNASKAERVEAAKCALPYCHPRLNAINHTGSMTVTHEDALAELERIDAGEEGEEGETGEAGEGTSEAIH